MSSGGNSNCRSSKQLAKLYLDEKEISNQPFILSEIDRVGYLAKVVGKICNQLIAGKGSISEKLHQLTDLYLSQPSIVGRAEVFKAIINYKVLEKDKDDLNDVRSAEVFPRMIKEGRDAPLSIDEILDSTKNLFEMALRSKVDIFKVASTIKFSLLAFEHPTASVEGEKRNYYLKESWPPVAAQLFASIEDQELQKKRYCNILSVKFKKRP